MISDYSDKNEWWEEFRMVIIDDNEMAEFIQNELLKQGTIVKKEDILKMLSLVFEFLKLKGVAHD